uniref:Uncharacterized protein n=1 Tax=Bicosoecida sp. CB-2014 TaxID=1486930 RepID=A0A7S1C7Z1_9STRA|mmetsp:Transcript_1518/g.4816  ORF Transcript_1518/g.4816 Transcript_1518/m.4816 type:complete len:380 (+) Transcript_1518:184-1323(+)|eukprot:CAMPEP_0203810256 /NCGR_PEP_ID=MMETSP0115-20131106/2831_1 /ASSEMBLY_ACC=CAM_ASM_000227 /TAXON_ID=33651 /ORGANISM="Bicosoecid sp, Strain ms1" /LENGTH=379 /DNA_ID=CAMNT_0050719043 /DNA_START=182 /DNA_END=1321 /DNA_ORIENTATION=-
MAAGGDPMERVDRHAAKLAREEAARRKRFLDAKTRTIGIDREALDAQVAEKRRKAREEKEEDAAWAEFGTALVGLAASHEVTLAERKAAEDAELKANWRLQRDPAVRAEWDLNDPEALRKDRPPRVGDDDPTCGPSGMQVFEGEDLRKAEREKAAAAAADAVIREQLALKAERAAAEAEEDKRYAEFHEQLAGMLAEQEAGATHSKLVEKLRLQQENLAAARERRLAARAAKAAEDEAALAEVERMRADPMLSESRVMAAHAEGMHRVRKDHYKGMSQEDLAEIRRVQAAQIEEARRLRAEAKAEDDAYYAGIAAACEFSMGMDAAASEERFSRDREHFLALKAQQRADRMRKKKEAEDRRNAGIDESWFQQWNKTSTI